MVRLIQIVQIVRTREQDIIIMFDLGLPTYWNKNLCPKA